MRRDRKVFRRLRRDGWSVLRLWEHDIKKKPEMCKRMVIRKVAERK